MLGFLGVQEQLESEKAARILAEQRLLQEQHQTSLMKTDFELAKNQVAELKKELEAASNIQVQSKLAEQEEEENQKKTEAEMREHLDTISRLRDTEEKAEMVR